MKTTPRNKMITSKDEIMKTTNTEMSETSENIPKSVTKKMQKFSFPHIRKVVQAESYEEALEIINKNKK